MLARIRHENVVDGLRRGRDRRRRRHLDGTGARPTLDNRRQRTGAAAAPAKRRRWAPTSRRRSRRVHAAGLLHCDVKAQNVVRESGGRVVLMDFGAGRLAPEARRQRSDRPTSPARRDTWRPSCSRRAPPRPGPATSTASACCVYFLVSGRYPVEGRTFSELRRAQEAWAFRSLRDVNPALPPALLDAVAGATERDPAKRFDSAGKVQEKLARVANEPDVAPPRSFRWRFAVSILSMLALAVAVWLTRPAAPATPTPTRWRCCRFATSPAIRRCSCSPMPSLKRSLTTLRAFPAWTWHLRG